MHQVYQQGEFEVTTDPARLDVAAIHQFLADESYWAKGQARAVLEKALAHSLNFGLYAGPRQIGLARVVTDYATYAHLCDMYVHADFRGRGLGQWLMRCVSAHPELAGLRRFGLVTRDAQGLYAQFGWTALARPERHMERLPANYYEQVG
ncbi:MAG: GNAT family N-acetyltransferase [Anaerolineales bacterium]|nr:GNAT family N-acetyltransferase [Anaerolineales bacterium]